MIHYLMIITGTGSGVAGDPLDNYQRAESLRINKYDDWRKIT